MRGGSEDRLLAWLRRRLPVGSPLGETDRRRSAVDRRHSPEGSSLRSLIGDDAAVLPAGGPFAVTVDSQIAGVHFVPDLPPAQLAARLLAVNLSDLAAMGALPAYAFLALTAAPDFDHRHFFRGLLAACARHRLLLAGGDLSRGAGETLVATLTLLGRKRRGARWLRRAGAAPGHDLWLGGTVGESAAGRLLVGAGARIAAGRVRLPAAWEEGERERGSEARPPIVAAARRAVRRHLLPRPQLELGQWLGRQPAGAAIDVSDGLALDLHRLCGESGVGARVEAGRLPLAVRFPELCAALGAGAERLALGGGEDYVLLFTLPAGLEPPPRFACRRIGAITAGRRLTIGARGKTHRLPPEGWDHLDGARQ